MDQPIGQTSADLMADGPLTLERARALLDRAAELLEAGDFGAAAAHYRRVIGFDDAAVTSAAFLGLAECRYRMDDEDGAVATWEAILELPETPSTYHAWRNIAAARVRDGDLNGAIAAYREADRRAPPEDKAEIANRLGWLAKETGNAGAARRYFARGRGAVMPLATYLIIGITVVVSLTAILSADGIRIYEGLALIKPSVADGEYWRLWTVTLLHGSPDSLTATLIHLGLNMYALFLVGPIVEQLYGPWRFVLFYLVAAAGGSIASYAVGDAPASVGASGAVFGMFGLLFIASRLHVPALDRRARAIAGQIGVLIVINIIIGFSSGIIDQAAHLGGLAAGALLGVAFAPTKVPTMRSMWQPGTARPLAVAIIGNPLTMVVAMAALVALMALGLYLGYQRWS